ncbi:hypothetical protein [uncultured Thiodictyon sp.]|uniref:hypothetical protein n=2 Tax=uncultured Thiodictyon sp. TaxID=1846217 RepID=UPI0025E5EACE|nr:hypothetical protein [uncultured Thiodictyon sp.]
MAFQTMRFQFTGLDARQVEVVDRRFGRFVVPDEDTRRDIECQCWRGVPEVVPLALLANRNDEYQPRVEYSADALVVRGYNFTASLDLAVSQAHAHLCTAGQNQLPETDVFDNYLRLAAAYVALARGGLLLHSAGVVIDGRAWLALGRSSAGKSTFARAALAAGLPILSDDINIVLPAAGGGFAAGPVPLTGDLRDQCPQDPHASYPVGGLLWLHQGAAPAVSPMADGERVARVLACALAVNADPYRVEAALGVIDDLLGQLPMRVLSFRRDEGFEALIPLIEEIV